MVRITSMTKAAGYHDDPHVAISDLRWMSDGTGESGRSSRIEMYNCVKGGGGAYVESKGNAAQLAAKGVSELESVRADRRRASTDSQLAEPRRMAVVA